MADSNVPSMDEVTSAGVDDVLYIAVKSGEDFLDRHIKPANVLPVSSVVYRGSGVPSNALGVNGNYYEDVDNGDVYIKAAGVWGSPIANRTGESWFHRKQTVAIVAGVVTVDYLDGRLIDVPVGANITDFVFTNWPADGFPGSVTFRFALSGTQTIAWLALGTAIRADGGVVPTVPASGSTLMVTIYSADALATVDILVGASDMKVVA